MTRTRLLTNFRTIFWLMFAINALNYLDRFVSVAVGPTIKSEFHLRDDVFGLLTSAFLLIYTIAAVPLGVLGDRFSRARIVSVGVALWSVASAATGVAHGVKALFATRAAVGIGEASYYPAGTALLTAYTPKARRAQVMSRWGAGQLVGIALAFGLSALLAHLLGQSLGWRVAFIVTGIPGLALAALMWFVADAPIRARSSMDARTPDESNGADVAMSSMERIRAALRVRTVLLVMLIQGAFYIAATPAITFLPVYVRSPRGPFHLGAAQASAAIGLIVVVGGLLGVLLGGVIADWLSRRFVGGRMLTAAVGFVAALPCYGLMLVTHHLPLFLLAATGAVLAMNLQAGPITAAVQDATPKALRSTAVGLTLLLAHLIGDVWSPAAVGHVSSMRHEHVGGALLAFGIPALVVGAALAFAGARTYAAEAARRVD